MAINQSINRLFAYKTVKHGSWFRLGLEFLRVRQRVRKGGPICGSICVGSLFGRTSWTCLNPPLCFTGSFPPTTAKRTLREIGTGISQVGCRSYHPNNSVKPLKETRSIDPQLLKNHRLVSFVLDPLLNSFYAESLVNSPRKMKLNFNYINELTILII